MQDSDAAVQSQNAVTAYFSSQHLLPFGLTGQNSVIPLLNWTGLRRMMIIRLNWHHCPNHDKDFLSRLL